MALFTCDLNREPERRHHPFIHMHEATITSPFRYFPALSPSDVVFKSTVDAVVPHLTLAPRATSPCFSTGSDNKTFYTAIEITDVKMHEQNLSPVLSELGSASPNSAFSISSVPEDAEESKCLIKTSTYDDVPSNDL